MSSVDISQVPELVNDSGYPVMFEQYGAVPLVYPLLGKIIKPGDLSAPFYAHKEGVIEGFEQFKEREDGQEIEAGTFNSAYSWYMKCRQYSRSIKIPGRMLKASDARAKVGSLVRKFAEGMGKNARIYKEDFIADMFQKGSLTAGSAAFFDGSSNGIQTDPYPKYIYDGLPWFDTAHTLTGSTSTFGNHTVSLALNHANLQTVLTTMTSTNAVNERGERVVVSPTVIMVPPGLDYTAKVILQSVQLSGSANNDINVLSGALIPIVNRALDDGASTSSWWVGEAGEGLEITDSGAPKLRTAYDPDADVVKVYAEFEFGAAVSNWRRWYCANKAA